MAITKQTPNTTADLGLVRVVPQWAQSDPRTTELVAAIRAQAPTLGDQAEGLRHHRHRADRRRDRRLDRLSGALVPFGLVVVGLP